MRNLYRLIELMGLERYTAWAGEIRAAKGHMPTQKEIEIMLAIHEGYHEHFQQMMAEAGYGGTAPTQQEEERMGAGRGQPERPHITFASHAIVTEHLVDDSGAVMRVVERKVPMESVPTTAQLRMHEEEDQYQEKAEEVRV